jgi:hypothetical protein
VKSVVNKTGSFNITRLRYKAAFDAYQAVAKRHAAITNTGAALSEQQRAEEQRAADELRIAREEMNAAASRLDY